MRPQLDGAGVWLRDGERIDADGNRIRLEGEEYRENGVKVMFKGMGQRSSGL